MKRLLKWILSDLCVHVLRVTSCKVYLHNCAPKRKLQILCPSSGSRNFGEGEQETWNISHRIRRPSFFGQYLLGGGGGQGGDATPPPGSATVPSPTTRNQGFMAHLIYLKSIYLSALLKSASNVQIGLKCTAVYLSIYLSISFAKIGLKCIYESASNVQLSDWDVASNVQLSELSDWPRHITWQNKLTLPQMYRKSASNVRNLASNVRTFEADPYIMRPILSEPIRKLYIWGPSRSDRLYIWGRFDTFEADSLKMWHKSNFRQQ